MLPILRGPSPISSIFRRFHTGSGFVEGSPNSIILIFFFLFFAFSLKYVFCNVSPSSLLPSVCPIYWRRRSDPHRFGMNAIVNDAFFSKGG